MVHRYNEKLIHFKLAKIKLEKVNNQFLLDVVETFNGYNFDGEQNDNIKNFLNRNKELDLKKAAKTVGEKNIEMIKNKELLPLTGYIHGGCSPVGMKKVFKTVIHGT